MTRERRNHYRLLHVQPEAPSEIIKAAYRALMSSLRAHPDLGGDPAKAASINRAYAVLMDPDQRRAYDRELQQAAARQRAPGASAAGSAGPRAQAGPQASAPARPAEPTGPAGLSFSTWQADRRCPFCRTGFRIALQLNTRCGTCESPLMPAPDTAKATQELLGRRAAPRQSRDSEICLRLPGMPHDLPARLRNLSLTGLAFTCHERIARGSVVRVISPQFDTLVGVVQQRSGPQGLQVHGVLLTLQLLRLQQGVFVSERA